MLSRLRLEKSSGTTLISLYLKGGVVNNTATMLKQELASSENIKSKQTKNDVQDALRMIRRNLCNLTRIPENGLAIFCGNGYYV